MFPACPTFLKLPKPAVSRVFARERPMKNLFNFLFGKKDEKKDEQKAPAPETLTTSVFPNGSVSYPGHVQGAFGFDNPGVYIPEHTAEHQPCYVTAQKRPNGRWDIYTHIQQEDGKSFATWSENTDVDESNMAARLMGTEIRGLHARSCVSTFGQVVERIVECEGPDNHIFNYLKKNKAFGAPALEAIAGGCFPFIDKVDKDTLDAATQKIFGAGPELSPPKGPGLSL
jgi:hypothetical protein